MTSFFRDILMRVVPNDVEVHRGVAEGAARPDLASKDMVVLGAGLPRTGTLSLRAALRQLLGGRVYHMAEVVDKGAEDAKFWIRMMEGGFTGSRSMLFPLLLLLLLLLLDVLSLLLLLLDLLSLLLLLLDLLSLLLLLLVYLLSLLLMLLLPLILFLLLFLQVSVMWACMRASFSLPPK